MAISWKVTQVCWSKSPSVKPAISDEKIRVGLLIRNGSIHGPEAICQSSRKPTTMLGAEKRHVANRAWTARSSPALSALLPEEVN